MSQDNVRLGLWITGIWGLAIIIIVGIEAITHDGPLAATVVDTFSKVLFGLGAVIGGISGLGKLFDAKVATSPVASVAANVAAVADATSDPAGMAAVDVPGEQI